MIGSELREQACQVHEGSWNSDCLVTCCDRAIVNRLRKIFWSCDDGIPDWIRTSNLRLRRPTLYPVELRGQKGDKTRPIMTRRDTKRQEALSARVCDTRAFAWLATRRDGPRRPATFCDRFLQSTLQSSGLPRVRHTPGSRFCQHAVWPCCSPPVPCPGVPVPPTFPRPFFWTASVGRSVRQWTVSRQIYVGAAAGHIGK